MHWDYGTTGLDDLMLQMFGLRASESRRGQRPSE